MTPRVAAGGPEAAEEASAAAAEPAQGSQPGSTSAGPRQAAKAGTAGPQGPAEDLDLKLSKEASKPTKEASKHKGGRSKALTWPLKRKPRGPGPTCEYWRLPTCVKVREGSRG